MADTHYQDEQVLIAALQQRDPQAFAYTFDQYANKIYRLGLSIVHDEQMADGVVQETFIKLFDHIERFEQKSQLSTWIYRVAYNEALIRLRRQNPLADWDDFEDDEVMPAALVDWQSLPEEVVSSEEAIHEMEQAIAQLSPALRLVFTLRDVEELSVRQTAEIMGISESAVKVRLHRARLLLREHLASYFEELYRRV